MRPKSLTAGAEDPAVDMFRFDDPVGYLATTPPPEASTRQLDREPDAIWEGTPPPQYTVPSDYVTLGGKWGASASFGTSGGTVTLIVNYPTANPAVTTTARGTLTRNETLGLEGDLTEDGASVGVSGPTFHYVLNRDID